MIIFLNGYAVSLWLDLPRTRNNYYYLCTVHREKSCKTAKQEDWFWLKGDAWIPTAKTREKSRDGFVVKSLTNTSTSARVHITLATCTVAINKNFKNQSIDWQLTDDWLRNDFLCGWIVRLTYAKVPRTLLIRWYVVQTVVYVKLSRVESLAS